MIPIEIQNQARYELARRYFWDYCKLKAPTFYKEDRKFLKNECNKLQEFYESDKKILVINKPPRHGKSRTATLFTQWLLGKNNHLKVMTGSYNETLSGTFAKQVRDSIIEENGIFNKVFPYTKIKKGEASMNKWALDCNEEANYLATSPTGTATGFGCNIMIIDDLIKTSEEAYNELHLEKLKDWFVNTMLQRTETGFKIIIIMTRWADKDLAGYVLSEYENIEHITYKAVQDDGSMLCDEILTKEDYEYKTRDMNLDIISANYQQETIDIKGRLYESFKEWDNLPNYTIKHNYTDTADTGADFLCSIDYIEYQNEAYITDITFTDENMEITEEEVAKMLYEDNVNKSIIESNNGGRGFARNVIRILKEKFNSNKCIVEAVNQSKNKESRILTSSSWVNKHIYMPLGWKNRYPKFYKHVMEYMRKGKNNHDDGPDVLSAIYEQITVDSKWNDWD